MAGCTGYAGGRRGGVGLGSTEIFYAAVKGERKL